MAKVRANSHYVPAVADPLSPITFVNKIKVPVYMACQWTDEQTGGHCPDLAEHFTGTGEWFTFTNGTHVDSLDPETFNRWYDFLELFVAHQAPIVDSRGHPRRGAGDLPVGDGDQRRDPPPDPMQAQPTYDGALAAFERLPPIRVLFDNGAGRRRDPRLPVSRASSSRLHGSPSRARGALVVSLARRRARRRSPPPGRARTPSPGTPTLGRSPTSPGPRTEARAASGPRPRRTTGPEPPAGTAASYLTSPLGANTPSIGAGAVHVWVRSSTPNVDLQATISEVRPDGNETFVQNGWVRANERKLDPRKSTLLEPVLSLRARGRRAAARQPVRRGDDPALLRGPRLAGRLAHPRHDQRAQRRPADLGVRRDEPQGHRQGGGGLLRRMPSRLILPVVPGVNVPTGLPPCPGLRGEPCRSA